MPKLKIFVGRLVGVIIFGSIRFLSKKVTKPKFVLKKNPTGFGSVRFGFLGQKLVQTGFGSFFFPVWLSFFSFRLIKPKPNRSVFSKL